MSADYPLQVRSQSVSDADEEVAFKDEEESEFLPSFNGQPLRIPAWKFDNKIAHRVISQRRWHFALAGTIIFISILVFGGTKHLSRKNTELQPLTETRTSPLPWCWSCNSEQKAAQKRPLVKPKDMPIIGVVFYGRRMTASILQCYLRRNLVTNGGLLDHVIFIARTYNQEDLAYLDEIIADEPLFVRRNIDDKKEGYIAAWDFVEKGVMYIKIDDDIVFVEDDAVRAIVERKLQHPEHLFVSANVINNPSLVWVHRSLGAIYPYMPEEGSVTVNVTANRGLWRNSLLPKWKENADGNFNFTRTKDPMFMPPRLGHRWLPAPDVHLDDTVIMRADFNSWGPALPLWHIAAQQHYSFLRRLEENTLEAYRFSTWDYNYMRLGIQFMAILGDEVIKAAPMEADDEHYLSEVVTKKQRRHAIVDGRATVAHLSFRPQAEGVAKTDLALRYRSFARENICQKVPSFWV